MVEGFLLVCGQYSEKLTVFFFKLVDVYKSLNALPCTFKLSEGDGGGRGGSLDASI